MEIKNSFLLTILLACILACYSFSLKAQNINKGFHFIKENRKTNKIDFELVNNLVIVPAMINRSDTLRFILDTGVKNTIISDLSNVVNGIEFRNAKKVLIRGLGDGEPLNAYITNNNIIELPGLLDQSHDIVILENDVFHFSSSLGLKVNGILGYNFFKDFIVEISYISKKITLYKPDKKLPKKFDKYSQVPITIVKGKPYINAEIAQNEENNTVKLLIDSGASSALSIFKTATHINTPENTFRDLIGVGLNGDIYGETGRLRALKIGKFSFPSLITTFPDENSIDTNLIVKNRHGSIGGEILKRFSVAYDYVNKKIYLRPNSDYTKKFNYNMSGLEIRNPISGIPVYMIASIRKNSVGEKAGFKRGDFVVRINGQAIESLSFNDINTYFQGKKGKRIKLTVSRDDKIYTKVFHLKDELKISEIEKKSNKGQLVARESEND